MSDSVTNVQIEDVLSSIRKLVSEEVRAQTRDARRPGTRDDVDETPKPDGAGAVASDDRLLLTPALRVAPGAASSDLEEAPFIHAEPKSEEADLLDLMARVRSAGTRQDAIERNRPAGIAPVERAKPADPIPPATEEAVRSALFSLGDSVRASIMTVDPVRSEVSAATPADTSGPEARSADDAPETSLSGDAALRLDARDTLAFFGRDDRVAERKRQEAESDVPKFLHRSGVTSLGQRIAEVEAVVTTNGGDWEPEADEEGAAAPEPSAVPWDEPAMERDIVETAALQGETAALQDVEEDAETDLDEAGNWSVAPDPVERDFQENPATAFGAGPRPVAPEAEDVPVSYSRVHFEDEEESELAVSDRDDSVDIHGGRIRVAETEEPVADTLDAQEAAYDEEAPEEAQAEPADPVEEVAPEIVAGARIFRAEAEVSYPVYDEDRETLSADDPTLFDEEMLRDLVAEIVRQELQGALGERITRNVRKLVRREIHRALSAHDLG